jgi:hypothetical protein
VPTTRDAVAAAPNVTGTTFWEVFMRLGDLFKKIFGSSAAIPVDERTLSSTNEDVLASSF